MVFSSLPGVPSSPRTPRKTRKNYQLPSFLPHSFYLGFQPFVFSFQLLVLRLQAFEQGILLLSVACSGSIHAFFDAALLHKQLL